MHSSWKKLKTTPRKEELTVSDLNLLQPSATGWQALRWHEAEAQSLLRAHKRSCDLLILDEPTTGG
jgi:hypothetical protein